MLDFFIKLVSFFFCRYRWIKNRSVKRGTLSTHFAAILMVCVPWRFIRLNLSSLRQVKTPLSNCGTFRKPYLPKSKSSLMFRFYSPFQPVSKLFLFIYSITFYNEHIYNILNNVLSSFTLISDALSLFTKCLGALIFIWWLWCSYNPLEKMVSKTFEENNSMDKLFSNLIIVKPFIGN